MHRTRSCHAHHPSTNAKHQFIPTSCSFTKPLQELRRSGFEVHSVPRGGETTYHGPGQLVAYPIINLKQLGLGARAFVEGLEDAMVQTAGCFGIQARKHSCCSWLAGSAAQFGTHAVAQCVLWSAAALWVQQECSVLCVRSAIWWHQSSRSTSVFVPAPTSMQGAQHLLADWCASK
jgi:hypothetical protein